jgi:hypothetical protein
MAMKSTDFHKVSKDDLLKYFPRGCGLNPSDLPDRNDIEATHACRVFANLPWDNVTENLILKCHDIPLLLSAEAFRYYLPSFIFNTQSNYKKFRITIECIVQIFADANYDDWAKIRCILYTKNQYILIENWLYWVSNYYEPHQLKLLEDAIMFVEEENGGAE